MFGIYSHKQCPGETREKSKTIKKENNTFEWTEEQECLTGRVPSGLSQEENG